MDGGKTWLENDIEVAKQPSGWTIDIEGVGRANGLPFTEVNYAKGKDRGSIYVCWSDTRRGNHDIWIAKSTDKGTTWGEPVRVNNDKGTAVQFFPAMTIDPKTGFIYVVFYDRREHTDTKTDVYLAVSTDAGKSFDNMRISESPFTPNPNSFFGDYNDISAVDGHIRPIWTRLEDGLLSVWTAIIDL